MTFYTIVLSLTAGMCFQQWVFPLIIRLLARSEHDPDQIGAQVVRVNQILDNYARQAPVIPRQGRHRSNVPPA